MKEASNAVRKFMIAAGQHPQRFRRDPRLAAFYTGMQLEELAEKLRVIFGPSMDLAKRIDAVANSFKLGTFDHIIQEMMRDPHDLAGMLDADLDLTWVSIASALAMGVDVERGWDEVVRSNHAKIGPEGQCIRDPETGKILKPEGWKGPQLQGAI